MLKCHLDPCQGTLAVNVCVMRNCGSKVKIKNPLTLVCLPRQMLSEIVCHDPVAPMAKEEKDWMQARSYMVETGHGYYPPNCNWAPTKQAMKISSKLVHSFKILLMILKNTDTQMDRHTNESPNYHIWVNGEFFALFFYLFTPYICWLRLLTLFCSG